MPSLAILSALVLASCMVVVNAECPNGCSGRGTCSSKDMCQCYKNFQGNDCSERTCGFGYAHTDTPKGDLDMVNDNSVVGTYTKTVVNSQVYPYGTYELYNNDAAADEAHFYMECSNQGLCDRETGDCVCFDGFEGSACQRASCPNSCSNHGSCESISEFATTAGGTLYTKGLSTGDTTYDLWDAKVSYGCKCDPWFTGADCSQRLCKVGADPMYYDTDSLSYDTVAIKLTHASDLAKAFRIRFWDYWGESYITNTITGVSSSGTAARIEAALEALPNGVISDASCKDILNNAAETTFFAIDAAVTVAATNLLIVCQFKSNPGALRLPEIYSHSFDSVAITGTPVRGEDANLCDTLISVQASADEGTSKIVFTSSTTAVSGFPKLAKIGDVYTVLESGTGTDYVTAYSFDATTADVYVNNHANLGSAVLTETNAAAFGATTLTMASGHGFAAGEKIICENQILNVVSVSGVTVTIDRPFFGTAKAAADAAVGMKCFEIGTTIIAQASTYVSECSGRGVCDRESGVCSCFKGYANDNCDRQSILAF